MKPYFKKTAALSPLNMIHLDILGCVGDNVGEISSKYSNETKNTQSSEPPPPPPATPPPVHFQKGLGILLLALNVKSLVTSQTLIREV